MGVVVVVRVSDESFVEKGREGKGRMDHGRTEEYILRRRMTERGLFILSAVPLPLLRLALVLRHRRR